MNRGVITISESGTVSMPTDTVWMTMQEIADMYNVFGYYVRELINNKAIGGRQSKWPIDILSLIDRYGTRTVKKIAVGEYLRY